jgi:hypothetical protein
MPTYVNRNIQQSLEIAMFVQEKTTITAILAANRIGISSVNEAELLMSNNKELALWCINDNIIYAKILSATECYISELENITQVLVGKIDSYCVRRSFILSTKKFLGEKNVGVSFLVDFALWQDLSLPHRELSATAIYLIKSVKSRLRHLRVLVAMTKVKAYISF